MTDTMTTIREVLALHGRLPVDATAIDETADLYQLGMTSHSSVNVMLALEDAFDIEFPEAKLRKATFESIASIAEALVDLGAIAPANN